MSGDLSFAIAFSAGLLSFLSPCVLPLIPSYLAFLLGDYSDQKQDKESYNNLKKNVKRHWDNIPQS